MAVWHEVDWLDGDTVVSTCVRETLNTGTRYCLFSGEPFAEPVGLAIRIGADIPKPSWGGEDTPIPVPQSVSPSQMRRALNRAGLRSVVDAAVAAADQDVRDLWEYATEVRRDNAMLAGMAMALGMSDTQVDDLFRLAGSIE